ncbi:hypothetical protein SAMN05877753_11136 [Bacillus oleivorans]|uniref:Uncharacterized protein n=1 Tax=Bacillus oleivorans TaxID=1448271 RepID=A0A285D5Q9_9BACI|nr:hypothetical protein [Bacillus oleivorans]SNX75154.1 hypothetical protein SAMN05877753_11136 [Bacillus oleivorans]
MNKTDWKKYFILLPPFVIVGLIILFILPEGSYHLALIVPILFWLVYYAWIYIENGKKKNESQ